ncbi:MAG: Hsp20 family protein [Candidatus Acidiferrum sp.]
MSSGTAVTMRSVPGAPQARPMAIDRALKTAREVYESISRRAFELFQSRKQKHGGDRDDWLRAESELLHTAHLDVEDCDDAIIVRAEVPGFRPDELEVRVELFRVTIAGRRETTASPTLRKTLFSDRCANRVFRVLDVPAELDSRSARSSLRDGILELEIPKASALTTVPIAVAAYWILRAEDHQGWTAVFGQLSENANGSNK